MFLGRTLVWYGDTLAGKQTFAEAFVLSCLERLGPVYQDSNYAYFRIENLSDIPFCLTDGKNPDAPDRMVLPARAYLIIRMKRAGEQKLTYTVSNVKTGTLERLKIEL